VTEVGALSAAGWAWSARGRHATVGSGRGCLGVVVAWQADFSGWLGATGRCTSNGGILVHIKWLYAIHVIMKHPKKLNSCDSCGSMEHHLSGRDWLTFLVPAYLAKQVSECDFLLC